MRVLTEGLCSQPVYVLQIAKDAFCGEVKTPFTEMDCKGKVRIGEQEMKLGLIQFAGSVDKDWNVQYSSRLITESAAQGAQIVCVHELANTIYFPFEVSEKYFALAETIPGPTVEAWQNVASNAKVSIVGTLFESVKGVVFYNSAVVIDSDGELIGVYRKNCIPHIRKDGRTPTGFEKYYFSPGDVGFPVFETKQGLRIGVLICFDRHFPENFRVLALAGAELICVPTTAPKSAEALWPIELQAAAAANGCWVAGVNRAGYDEAGADRCWFGGSLLVSPDGEVIVRAQADQEDIVISEIDPKTAAAARFERGYFRDRRPEFYGALSQLRD